MYFYERVVFLAVLTGLAASSSVWAKSVLSPDDDGVEVLQRAKAMRER